MPRIISPPIDQIDKLRPPLWPGERQVLDFFVRELPDWDIFIQPHLNGLRPDFVLLNSNKGIAVFEVKDWDLNALDYFIDIPDGRPPRLMGRRDGKTFSRQKDNPIDKVCMYKQEIFNLYCPRLDQKLGLAVITAGVIFPFADDDRVKKLFSPCIDYKGLNKYPTYYPISGINSLLSRNLKSIFPASQYLKSEQMNEIKYNDLKIWLIEPDAPIEQREKLNLSEKQLKFATTTTKSGYRRIKGPAGSGKSLVLAARAAHLVYYEKKDVLVLTYNITLINYLADLSVRCPYPGAISRKDLTFLSFYEWCKRICFESGHINKYKNIWREHYNHQINDEEGLWTLINQEIDNMEVPLKKLVELVASILDDDINKENISYYDSILVDEGQFFLPEWWQLLRKVCKNGGEMMLVADKTQDIYGNAKSWTDLAMVGAGFQYKLLKRNRLMFVIGK
ncbi:MAG: AAA family ATPase [Deltaproteobacteria bacterium]|nr:AAA family ATPase [Deltaproteobacteria bacterium]